MMDKQMGFKIGQIVGACFMIAAVAACNMQNIQATPALIFVGALIYGGSRLAAWLTKKN